MLPRPHAVLLDLDGTLLDTLEDITVNLGRGLARHGYPKPSREEVARMVGDGAMALVARALAPLGVGEAEVALVHASFLEEYAAAPAAHARPSTGCFELLDALAAAGIAAVVCTNKRGLIARRIIAQTFPGRALPTVGGGDAPRLKPAPDLLRAALATVGVSGPAWMVGDSEQDVLAARAAGLTAIGVRHGYGDPKKLDAAGPDLLVDDLTALIPLLSG